MGRARAGGWEGVKVCKIRSINSRLKQEVKGAQPIMAAKRETCLKAETISLEKHRVIKRAGTVVFFLCARRDPTIHDTLRKLSYQWKKAAAVGSAVAAVVLPRRTAEQ